MSQPRGNELRLLPVTPSRLSTWLDCPRRYRLQYLDRPKPPPGPPWAHNSFGTSVHNALAGWWSLPREHRTPEAAGDLLDAGWISDGFRDGEQAAQWRSRAREMVVRYANTLDPGAEPAGVERTMAARSGVMAVSGRVDRVDERPCDGGPGDVEPSESEAVVVDYKTGRHPLTDDDARTSLALALYAVITEATLRLRCRRVELHYLPTGEVHAWQHTEQTLERHTRRAQDIAVEADAAATAFAQRPESADELFPVRPSALCAWCDMRAHCPAGADVEPRRPWDGLG